MPRNNALDFVKGAAVVTMAAHHSINYFPAPYLSTKYVHFVSGAFPFLAGFLVSNILAKRTGVEDSKGSLGLRLAFRGARLLILCGALNFLLAIALGHLAKFGRLPREDFLGYISLLYWSGNYREVSFSLLIPIGYVLILLGLLVRLKKLNGLWMAGIGLLTLVFCVAAESFAIPTTYYSGYIVIGVVGAACGCISTCLIDKFCKKWLLIFAIYVCSAMSIGLWGLRYILFVINVVAALMTFYAIGLRVPAHLLPTKWIALLGQYSLIMYIMQIVVLFIFRVIAFNWLPEIANVFCGFASVCIAQIALCGLIDRLRRRSGAINMAYTAVFA
jgi:peptidoglycan/LPS O-acetylase OafA/YrhL